MTTNVNQPPRHWGRLRKCDRNPNNRMVQPSSYATKTIANNIDKPTQSCHKHRVNNVTVMPNQRRHYKRKRANQFAHCLFANTVIHFVWAHLRHQSWPTQMSSTTNTPYLDKHEFDLSWEYKDGDFEAILSAEDAKVLGAKPTLFHEKTQKDLPLQGAILQIDEDSLTIFIEYMGDDDIQVIRFATPKEFKKICYHVNIPIVTTKK